MRNPDLTKLERDLAVILEDRLHFVRAADPRTIADLIGMTPRGVNQQADGTTAVQMRTCAALAVDDPEGARLLAERLLSDLGYELRPSVRALASVPTLHQALRGIADSAVCCSESTAMEYASLHDGRIEPHELAELQAQWAREDQTRQGIRDRLAAMCETVKMADQLGRLRAVAAK